ncbi:zinc transporter 1, partial [Brachionus plicatilis]
MNNKVKKDENTKQYFTKTILISTVIILTSCFFLVELVVGHITRSNALVADSFHIFGDMLSLVVGLVAVRISKRKTSKKNTFGWTRAEVLGSLVNCVLLQALCFTIVIESVTRFLEPEPIDKVDLLLSVGGARLTLNIITLSLFSLYKYKERKNKTKKDLNMNLQSVFLNAIGDSLGSVAVIVSGLIIKFAPPKDVLDV